MCQDVGLEVCGLCELFVAPVEGADVGSVSRVDAYVRAQVEVQRESLPAALERALKRLLARMNKLKEGLQTVQEKVVLRLEVTTFVYCTWCLLSLELSTKAFPHSAHT